MKKNMFAIVPAAGLGRRFGSAEGKTFVALKEVPLLVHTLSRLQSEDAITEIIPVLREQDIKGAAALVKTYQLSKIRHFVQGGPERQDSIYNALTFLGNERTEGLETSLVLIHDGVRPVIPEGTVRLLVQGLENADGAIPGIPPKDTLKKIGSGGLVLSTIDREEIRAVQTPQLFRFSVIKKAYDLAYRDHFYATDDAALVERMGGTVTVIDGSPSNIKVTTQDDLQMVEYLLRNHKVISSR